MPTYEYRCAKCGYNFEEFQSITAKPLVKCPQCNRPTLKRLLGGGGGMIFKGSGFYMTDYKNAGRKEKNGQPPSTKKDEKGSTKDTPPPKPSPSTDTDSKSGSTT
jgi:putative FmdB family regulatory protein